MTDTVSSGPAAASSSDDRNMAMLGYALLFTAPFFAGLTAIAAVALAYIRRPEAEAVTRTHYGYQIKVFWIGFALALLTGIAIVTGVGVLFGDFVRVATNGGQGWDAWDVAGIDESDFHLRPVSLVSFLAALGLGLLTSLWLIAASVVGLIRLGSQKPMGRTA